MPGAERSIEAPPPSEVERRARLNHRAYALCANSQMNRDAVAISEMAEKLLAAAQAFLRKYDHGSLYSVLRNGGFTEEQAEACRFADLADPLLHDIAGLAWACEMAGGILWGNTLMPDEQRAKYGTKTAARKAARTAEAKDKPTVMQKLLGRTKPR